MSEEVRVKPKLVCGPGRTRPEFKEQADVKRLVGLIQRGAVVPPPPVGRYMDCVGVPDMQGALELVRRASEVFNGLPAKLRRELRTLQGLQEAMEKPEGRKYLLDGGCKAEGLKEAVKADELKAKGAGGAQNPPKATEAVPGAGAAPDGAAT